MFWTYAGELLRRVFFPTTRGADYVSVLIPLAVSATAYFAGVKVSEGASTQILAYVGLFTVLMFLFRLLISGPYGMWREQITKVGSLNDQLARPEQAVLEHLAKHRAKARAKLSSALEELQGVAYANPWNETHDNLLGSRSAKVWKLEAAAGLSKSFILGRRLLMGEVAREGKISNDDLRSPLESQKILTSLQAYLMGEITAEALALRLPPSTAPKTPL